ncbi:family 16 glycosylhydrolase [Bradyrhizobium manausense]|uniref:family 16 glycosylhydrolase n=1 Tax=Bradyrhizobium manausense TaxID=989370 RepID=UPI001BAA1678|nr:family 16 glycosylhydrolase [Bradyrhizobium manausense]MBR1092287.1 family 16 glycosylhydrolase [Bradyrhizobium manausense]
MAKASAFHDFQDQLALLSSDVPSANHFMATAQTQVIVGKSGGNIIRGNGHDTLVGGNGDDTYYVYSSSDKVVELPGGGIDTVVATVNSASYTLPENVENLTITGTNATGYGNGLQNLMVANGPGAITLDGMGGNDVLVGGAGPDTFVMSKGYGSEVIYNFDTTKDQVRISGFQAFDFKSLKADMSQVGNDVVIKLGATDSVILRNVNETQLSAKNFEFPIDLSKMKLTFDDEFNTFSASADGNGTVWQTKYVSARTISANHEAEYYSDASVGVNPFKDSGGVLSITAAPAAAGSVPAGSGLTYTSGVITTAHSFAQLYGYFEAKVELPSGAGFWPAFWLLPADGSWPPELDVFEQLGQQASTLYLSTHSKVGGPNVVNTVVADVANTTTEYHTYGVDWEKDFVTYYVDGVAVGKITTPADMNKPMYMLLNLAVGANGSWPGAADGHSSASMKIDYVKAYASADSTYATSAAVSASTYSTDASVQTGSAGHKAPSTMADLYSATGSKLAEDAAHGVLANDKDLNGVALSAKLGSAASHGVVQLNADGSFLYTAKDGFAGTDSFTYIAYDQFSQSAATTVNIAVAATVSGDGVKGAVNLAPNNVATGLVYSAGSGDKTIDTGNGNVAIDSGSGNNKIHLGSGTDVVTFGSGISNVSAGSGQDTFIFDGGRMPKGSVGGQVDTILYFQGTDGSNSHDLLKFKNFAAGSDLAFKGYVSAASHQTQSYNVVDAAGHVEGTLNVAVQANHDGTYHLLAHSDYMFV